MLKRRSEKYWCGESAAADDVNRMFMDDHCITTLRTEKTLSALFERCGAVAAGKRKGVLQTYRSLGSLIGM